MQRVGSASPSKIASSLQFHRLLEHSQLMQRKNNQNQQRRASQSTIKKKRVRSWDPKKSREVGECIRNVRFADLNAESGSESKPRISEIALTPSRLPQPRDFLKSELEQCQKELTQAKATIFEQRFKLDRLKEKHRKQAKKCV